MRRNDNHGGDHVPVNKTAAAKKRKVDQLVAPMVVSKVKGSAAGKQAGTKRKVRDDEGVKLLRHGRVFLLSFILYLIIYVIL